MSYPVFHVPAGDVLPVMFATYAGSTGASVTLTGLAVTDIEIYKDGSATQRSSDAGYTLLDTDGIDFDGLTGIHGFSIDTGDNTDAGFYTVGAWFTVVVSAVTVDSQTVSFIACQFRLMAAESIAAKPKVDVDAWLGTAAATPTVAGVPEVDLTHVAGSTTNVAALATNVDAILTDTGTTLQAELDGIQADTEDIQTRLPAALVSGRIDASVGAMAANVLTATAINADAITAAKVAADVTTEIQSGLATASALATVAGYIDTEVAAILSTLGTPAGASIAADIAAVTAPTAAAVADAVWDEVLSGHLTSGTTGAALNGAGAAGDPWGTALPGAYGAGSAGYLLGTNLDATVSSRATAAALTTVDGIVDDILADTADMQPKLGTPAGASLSADVAAIKVDTAAILVDTGTTLQAELDGIQADTEDIQTRLPAALVAGRIDASVGAMAANVMTAAAAAADLTTELQAGLATSAAIAALNNLSSAQVQTAAAAALTAYDPPTNTEMEARTLVAANYATAAALTAVDDFLDTEIAAILAAVDTETSDILADTAALETRLTAAIANKLAAHTPAILQLVVGAGSTTTAVVFSTVEGAAPSATNDFYNGRVIIFTSGALAGQATSITDWTGGTVTATVPALTGAPANGVTAIIV